MPKYTITGTIRTLEIADSAAPKAKLTVTGSSGHTAQLSADQSINPPGSKMLNVWRHGDARKALLIEPKKLVIKVGNGALLECLTRLYSKSVSMRITVKIKRKSASKGTKSKRLRRASLRRIEFYSPNER